MISSKQLLTAWPKNMWKKSAGFLLPHPMHVPCNVGFQFLRTGLQGKSASMKKVNPQSEHINIMPQVIRRASRY